MSARAMKWSARGRPRWSDELVTVGERAQVIAASARQAGLPASAVTELSDSQQAIEFLKAHLKEQDVVLVKGSHGMRMDRIVAALETSQ